MAIPSSPSRWVTPRLLPCALLLLALGLLPAAAPLAHSADDAPAAAAAPAPAAAQAVSEMETRAYYVPLGNFGMGEDGTAESVFAEEDDDDDDDDEAADKSVSERYKEGLAQLGIGFPEGSSLLYSERTQNLVVRNSREEHERLGRLLGWICDIRPSHIQVKCTVIRIGTGTAADWGLDGLPPARPETSPFAGPVPRRMSEKQSALFFAALRKTEGFEVLGTTEVTTISGQTANVQGVER